jgi:hypothetical protein
MFKQGCQIFRGPNYQNGEKIYQMTSNYTKRPLITYTKWPLNIPKNSYSQNIQTFSIPRPSKIYPNFGFENKPSGNPGLLKAAALCKFGSNILF